MAVRKINAVPTRAADAASNNTQRLVQRLAASIRNAAILAAFARVPREAFLDNTMAAHSSDDVALPIGYEQTTSQPFVIARMLEMLHSTTPPPARVLEVGAGCGYQTALLAELGYDVVAIERIRPLATAAQKRLRQLGYGGVEVVYGDGFNGYAAKSPYNGVVVCAECQSIPTQLLPQLHPQGYVVLPLARADGAEVRLCLLQASGRVCLQRESVAFVPMKEGVA